MSANPEPRTTLMAMRLRLERPWFCEAFQQAKKTLVSPFFVSNRPEP